MLIAVEVGEFVLQILLAKDDNTDLTVVGNSMMLSMPDQAIFQVGLR